MKHLVWPCYDLASLYWLPVKFRIEFKILLLTFKALNDQAPSYLKEQNLMYLPEHCAPSMQAYLWFLVSLKVGWEAEPSVISCGSIFQIWSRGQTPSLCLRVGLKLSFLIKLIVRALRALSLCCYRLRLPGNSPSIYIH